MVQPDPALGFNVAFPQAQFENAIKFAMQMGTPNEAVKRPTFIFPGDGLTYWRDGVELVEPPRVDLDGHPYDPEIEVRRAADVELQVDCAFEVKEVIPRPEDPVGTFQHTQLVVTLLEAEYQQVKHCKAITYNSDRYLYGFESELYGLFGSDVHTIIFVSEDDS